MLKFIIGALLAFLAWRWFVARGGSGASTSGPRIPGGSAPAVTAAVPAGDVIVNHLPGGLDFVPGRRDRLQKLIDSGFFGVNRTLAGVWDELQRPPDPSPRPFKGNVIPFAIQLRRKVNAYLNDQAIDPNFQHTGSDPNFPFFNSDRFWGVATGPHDPTDFGDPGDVAAITVGVN